MCKKGYIILLELKCSGLLHLILQLLHATVTSVTVLVKHCLCIFECRLSCPRHSKGAEGTGHDYVVSGGGGLAYF
jgi:hypothetical protein